MRKTVFCSGMYKFSIQWSALRGSCVIARSPSPPMQMSAGHPTTQFRGRSLSRLKIHESRQSETKLPVHLIFNQVKEQPDNVDPLRLDWSPAVWDASSRTCVETTRDMDCLLLNSPRARESSKVRQKSIRDVGLISAEPSEVIMCEKMILIEVGIRNKHS